MKAHRLYERKTKQAHRILYCIVNVLLFLFLLISGTNAAYGQEAKYIILMIADGQGPNHIEATNAYTGIIPTYQSQWARYWRSTFPYGGSYDTTQAWTDFNYVLGGWTDSAASASALYSGIKTNNGRVSVSNDASQRFFTIGEIAKSLSKGVGVVTTVPISDATPGVFCAHNDNRGNTYAIADECLFGYPNTTGTVANDPKYGGGHGPTSPSVDVIIGDGRYGYVNDAIRNKLTSENGQPGKHFFVKRQTGIDGGDALWAAANDPTVAKLAGLFDHIYRHDPSYSMENPTLAESAKAALTVLHKNPNGFVLMIEGGAVDWASHSNNMDLMIGEMIDFNEAVQTVIDWVDDPNNDSDWSNTLVIITADHETGYLTASPGIFQDQPLGEVSDATLELEKIIFNSEGLRASWVDSDNDNVIDPSELVYWAWNSGGHTNTLIPLYARGAGAELFQDYAVGYDSVRGPYLDNTDVFSLMHITIRQADEVFIAYNDLSWSAGQVNSNITVYTTGQSGLLKDYVTGINTTVMLSVAGGYVEAGTLGQGGNADIGTDAYNVFNGIVNSLGLISYSVTNLTFTFTGLDPNLRYEFVLFGNRNEASYTNRLTTTVISDVSSFTNASTPGANFSGPSDPSVAIVNGYNTINGYVARFANIKPGADGDMRVTASSGDGHFYANAVMLKAVQQTSNQPPTAVNDAATTTEATPVSINVIANDTDPDGTINPATVTITGAAGHGTAVANVNGTVTYTPNAGFTGTDTFKYTVKDNEGATSNEATVTVTVAPGGAYFYDDFSTNTTGGYTVTHTWTSGGFGQFLYDSAGQRARVRTGDNIGLQFSHALPLLNTGTFSIDFLPTVKYPSGGRIFIRLVQDQNTYYELHNTDGYGPQSINKVINAQVADSANFQNGYAQNTPYHITINFSPNQTTVTAFGNVLTMNTNHSSIMVSSFEIEVEQQDAYFDNIVYTDN